MRKKRAEQAQAGHIDIHIHNNTTPVKVMFLVLLKHYNYIQSTTGADGGKECCTSSSKNGVELQARLLCRISASTMMVF